MNAFEDAIDGPISVSRFPPAFNDAGVVSVGEDSAARARESGEGIYKEFETDGFCPSDVANAIVSFPPRDKSPGSPEVSNDNANANA